MGQTPPPLPEIQRPLMFSQRNRLADELTKWMAKHNVAVSPVNIISMLDQHGLLNREAVRQLPILKQVKFGDA